MGDNVVRRYTADSPAPDDWWAGPEVAPEPQVLNDYDERDGVMALERLSTALHALGDALNETDLTVADATRYMAERLDLPALAGTVALVQDLKRRLGLLEAYLSREAGHVAVEVDLPRKGVLPDGRPWELRRGKDRKGWDHEDWKRDVRQKVVEAALVGRSRVLVDPDTGEELDVTPIVFQAVQNAQEVHGSTAPRVGQLRALTLDPDDYAETSPGTWGFTVTPPTTTNDSGEQNG